MRLLDRYVLRNFFEPFLICFFGFLSIWLVFDLSDNIGEFIDAKASMKVIAGFYITQLPQIILITLPVGLLLALLFSLSKMSRSNEIISMLTAGQSVARVILPLVVVGTLCSLALFALNYRLAPQADAIKKAALEAIARGRKTVEREAVEGHLFRDRQTLRTWYVKKMRRDSPTLDDVHITQQDEEGNITRRWYADRASWDPRTGNWVLLRGIRTLYDKEGNETETIDFTTSVRTITKFPETPWRIASSSFEPQNLSVPELRDYLKYNRDFPQVQLAPFRTYLHHRFALPWTALVVVFIAAPLGIVFSRRGVLAGVASSIFIFFGMIFITNLFLALGKGDRLSGPVDKLLPAFVSSGQDRALVVAEVAAGIAAWFPIALIGITGLVLLYFRSTNRELPKLGFKRR